MIAFGDIRKRANIMNGLELIREEDTIIPREQRPLREDYLPILNVIFSNTGILQNEIWKKTEIDQYRVRDILNIFENENIIRREWKHVLVNGKNAVTKLICITEKGQWFWKELMIRNKKEELEMKEQEVK